MALTMSMRSVKDLYFCILFTAFISLIQQWRETIHCPVSPGPASPLERYRDESKKKQSVIESPDRRILPPPPHHHHHVDLVPPRPSPRKQQNHHQQQNHHNQQQQLATFGDERRKPLQKHQHQPEGAIVVQDKRDAKLSTVKNALAARQMARPQPPQGALLPTHKHHQHTDNQQPKKQGKDFINAPKPKLINELISRDKVMEENLADPHRLEQWFRERLPPNPPRPVQIMKEYIQQHSIWSHGPIAREGQKYMVVSYQCPHRAGNVLATFLNQMLIAVLTNRTAVFYIRGTKGEQVCDGILQRAPWIPRLQYGTQPFKSIFKFYQYKTTLQETKRQLNVPQFPLASFRSSIERELMNRNATAAILAQDLSDYDVIEIRGLAGCFHSPVEGWEGRFDWTIPSCRDYITALFQKESIDVNRANQLFELGIDFVYGMLFRLAFDLTPGLLNSITYSGEIDPNAFSIGIHSRHAKESEDGSSITLEKLCLGLLLKRRPPGSTCQFLVMSDRPATFVSLEKYAAKQNCEVVNVQHSTNLQDGQYLADVSGYSNKDEVSAEHGPFEGAGFFKDLFFVSQAHHALICTMRSSSALIKQAMEYDNVMRYYRAHSKDDYSMEKYQSPETCFYEGNMIANATIAGMNVRKKELGFT